VRKTWDEVKHLRRDRRKREAEFAAKFYEQCGDPHVKHYAELLGYAALVGDNHLSVEERRFLLSVSDPQKAIDKYLRTYPWVRISVNQTRFDWKKDRYRLKSYRYLARAGYLLAYVGWAYFAGAPIIFRDSYDPQHKLSAEMLAIPVIYCMAIGVPLALICIRRFFLLGDAATLIRDTTPLFEQSMSIRPPSLIARLWENALLRPILARRRAHLATPEVAKIGE
jgi:hypothetical protein